jgi:dTMP kinase
MEEGTAPRSVAQLIRRGQFARLFWAGAVSSLGDWVSLFAAIALGNDLGGTAGISVPLLARFLPAVFIGAISGVLADRYDAKWVMVGADVGRMVLVSFLVFVDSLQMLFIITMAIEVLSIVRQPAREAAMASVVTKEELLNANSASIFITYGMIPVAGLVWTGVAALSEGVFDVDPWKVGYALDAVTFAGSALIILTLSLPVRAIVAERAEGGFNLRQGLRDFADGVKYVMRVPAVRIPMIAVVWALVGAAPIFVLGEPFSREVLGFGSTGFGILATAIGVGMAVGVIAARWLDRSRMDLPVGLGLALGVAGVGVIGVAFTDQLITAATGGFTAGFGTGAAYVIAFTSIHSSVEDELRGRTFGTLYALARMGIVVSLAAAPLLATALDGVLEGEMSNGVRLTILLSGVLVVSAGLAAGIGWLRHQRRESAA